MDFKVTNSFSRDNLNYGKGTVKNIHYGDIHTKFQTLFDITKENTPYINENITIGKIPDDNYCKEGDIIFADASEDLNDIGKSMEIVNLNNEKLLSGLHTLLARPKGNLFYKGFNGYLFKSNSLRTQIQKVAQGTKVLSISVGRISNVGITYPMIPEQERIVSFLSLLDGRIQTQNKIIEELKLLKDEVRKKVFSQELRFMDETGKDFPEWKGKRFREVYTFRTTNSYSRENLNYENGIVKNIHYGDIHTKFSTLFDIRKENVPFINPEITIQKISNENYLKEGDLVIADASEDYEDVGKSIEIVQLDNQKMLAGLHTILARPELAEMAVGFGGHLLKSPEVRTQIMKIAQGSKVLSISAGRLANIILNIPNAKEQTKITNFLSSLDEKINVELSLLQQMEYQKQYLLQNLFI